MSIVSTIRRQLKRALYTHVSSVSQIGQDAWVMGEVFNGKRGGYFVDIGAHDGIEISNTYLLERRFRWRGLLIEANPVTFERCRAERASTCLNICLDRSEGEVEFVLRDVMGGIVGADTDNQKTSENVVRLPTRRLIDVLSEQKAPTVIDYLSIDVEGAEDRVLGDFDFSAYRFNCISIERPSKSLRSKFSDAGYILIKELPAMDVYYVHASYVESYQRNIFDHYLKKRISITVR